MGLANYTELKASVADWLNRSDMTAVIPDLITMAEAQLNRDVRHHKMLQRSTAQFDSQYSAVPADFVEASRLFITDTVSVIEQTTVADIVKRRAETNNATGTPAYYTLIGQQFEVYPTPDSVKNVELLYYSEIPALSASNATNWLLTMSPDAYLYGTLLTATPYLSNDERLETWGALYASAISNINQTSVSSRFGGANLRLKIRSY